MSLYGSWGAPRVHPSLWVQLSSMQTSDSMDAAAAKTQFLQNVQTTVSLLGLWEPGGPLALNLAGLWSSPRRGWCGMARATLQALSLVGAEGLGCREVFLTHIQSGRSQPRLSAAEVEVEARRLQKACSLLRLRVREELSAGQWVLGLSREEHGGLVQGGFPDCHGPHLPSLTLLQPPWTGCRSTAACSRWRACRPWWASVCRGCRNCVQVRLRPHPATCTEVWARDRVL